MERTRIGTPYEEFAKGFETSSVFPHMHCYDLYRKWLEATWAFLNAPIDNHTFRECLDKYTYDQGAEFGRLLNGYTYAAEEMPFQDILGQVFMRLDVNSVRAGQYFTPWPVAEMMARMQFSREDFEAQVAEKGEVSVCDPAVGSGVMLLAFAKVVHDEMGRSGVNKLRLYGTDIDECCVLMCRIQLRMNGLDSFGRMAGLLGCFSHAEGTDDTPPTVTLSELNTTVAIAPEPPDLSTAVVLHNEDEQRAEKVTAEQLALF